MYMKLRRCWSDVVVPNVHGPTEDECDEKKESFCEELEYVLD